MSFQMWAEAPTFVSRSDMIDLARKRKPSLTCSWQTVAAWGVGRTTMSLSWEMCQAVMVMNDEQWAYNNVKTQELLLELVDTSNIWSLDINKREISACIGVNRKSLRLCMWHCDPQFAGKWPGSSGGVDEQGCHCFSSSKPIVDHARADELRE